FRRITGGELRIKAVSGYKLSGFPYSFADYVFTARTRALSAQGGTYGMVSRLQPDGNSGYLFVIRDPDTFAVARLDGGKPVLLRRGQAALATDWNRLEVRSLGATHTFRVNGAVVATFSDDRYPRGGIGLWVDEHRDAAFDDLLVEGLAAEQTDLPANGDSTPVPRQSDVVLLEERFDPPQMHWQEDAHREIRDGALRLSAPAQRFIISGVADGRYVDYSVTTECERLDGPATGRAGLVVRLQGDGRTGYVFAVDASSGWVVLRFDPGDQAVELARGEAAWRPGVNTLAARCQGDRLNFAVNGASVVAIRDPAYRGGGFGLYVDNGTVARFDNILALRPAP
ncbi:MAG: hypothetical protein HYU66_10565, partial [Armatimonadetes bacterium]|nr:hypothetical protein [Armatimonadota bacterium]